MPFSDVARVPLLALAALLAHPPAHAASCPDPASLAVIGGTELSDPDDLIERPVTSADGHLVGVVLDVVLDSCGTPAALVVALPYTQKDVAIPVDRVRLSSDGEILRLDGLTASAVAALPPTSPAAVSLGRR